MASPKTLLIGLLGMAGVCVCVCVCWEVWGWRVMGERLCTDFQIATSPPHDLSLCRYLDTMEGCNATSVVSKCPKSPLQHRRPVTDAHIILANTSLGVRSVSPSPWAVDGGSNPRAWRLTKSVGVQLVQVCYATADPAPLGVDSSMAFNNLSVDQVGLC